MARFALLLLLASLSGCSWVNNFLGGTDNIEPPTPLTPLTDPLAVQSIWRTGSGTDSRDKAVRLLPILGKQDLYLAGFNGRVVAVDRDTGSQRWSVRKDFDISGGVGSGEEMVLVASTIGDIVALDADTGEERWRVSVSRGVLSPPEAGFGVVVVRAVDGSLYGLDAADGSRLWRFDSTQPALTLRGTSSPVLVQNAVIVGMDNGKVAILDVSTGRPFWERTVAPPRGRSELDRMVDIDATPLVVGKVLYVGTFQGQVVALDAESGKILWSKEMSVYAGMDVDQRYLYVTAADGAVWALDRLSGATAWRQDALRYRSVSGPALLGEYVVVGDFEGYLHWLSREDGRLVGRVRLGKHALSAPPVSDGNTLYAQGLDGTVGAYRLP